MWTDEQIQAINIIDVNTTVSASAGAGKTAVLVERLMKRILIDKVSVDEIVSLTFTDAAAAEMKNRLMSALLEKQKQEPDNAYIFEQITLLPNANISTIHSFCLRLLKDYYYVLEINPDSLNNIISESELLTVENQAFEYALANYPSDKTAELMTFLSNKALNLDRLNDIIKDLVGKANARINPREFISQAVSAYRSYDSINDLPEPYLSLFYSNLKDQVDIISQSIMLAQNYLDSLDSDLNREDQLNWLKTLANGIFNLYTAIKEHDYQALIKTFDNMAGYPSKTLSKHKDFTQLRGNIIDHLNTLAKSLYDEEDALAHLAILEKPLNTLKDLALIYNDFYKQRIVQLNKITFNDMETLTYQLLAKNDQEVAKILRKQISDILVDEFQDTNQLQNAIINMLGNGSNIFRVGDVKQSIYRFRGAQPEIMQELIDQDDSHEHKTLYLSKNFRSSETIVEYNNHLFKNIMNIEGFTSTYDEFDSVAVGTDGQKTNNLPVELILINSQSDGLDAQQAEMDNQYLKATYIAKQIVEMTENEIEPDYKKFTVLANAHSIKHPLKRAFDEANIPYFIALPDGLYETAGVAVVLAYLKLINDPSDKLALMTILTELYNFSDNQITREFLKENNLIEVANKLDPSIFKTVYYYNQQQYNMTIAEIVDHITAINSFYEKRLSKQNRTNYDIFFEDVILYDQEHVGIYGFLKKIDLIKLAKAKEGSSISSEDNVVNVMTIHNSKGLQFENVFLMSKSIYRDNDATSKFMIHPQLGLAIKTSIPDSSIEHNNLIHNLIKQVDHQESIEEEMRVLYVALTRAQKKLFIVDSVAIKEDDSLKSINLNKSEVLNSSFTKWINATHYHEPSRYLNLNLVEEFTSAKAKVMNKPIHDLVKYDQYKHYKQDLSSDFIPNPLALSNQTQATDIGSLIHNTIEKLDGHSWTKADILNISHDLSNYYLERILNLGNHPFFIDLHKHQVLKEVPFIYSDKDQSQRGIIDFLAITDQEIIILDFKSDSLELESDFIDRYKRQLDFYAQALALEYPDHAISKYIYSLKLETFIKL